MYWETEHMVDLPWTDMAAGYWWRYPNPLSQHVLSVDTLDTRLEGDKLYHLHGHSRESHAPGLPRLYGYPKTMLDRQQHRGLQVGHQKVRVGEVQEELQKLNKDSS